MDEVRIDKWLWAMRIFKTRSQAAEACKKGRVSIGVQSVKASHAVHIGDIIKVRKSPVTYTYKALQLTENRLGAKLTPDYVLDMTPPEEIPAMNTQYTGMPQRERGAGRPTKKERRDLDDFFNM
ncbi:MAG: RNA-binding S4 domain-containing protein [Bacteroidales bacterium]|jgi:ribosome-associated heat shock protein Hsp15|nr:RNA-binding S4 domain-containing protein [Bacteroidales bacterium]